MDPSAVQQAKGRLARAKAAIAVLRTANREDDIISAWIDFLYAFNAVYNKLHKGSFLNGKSRPWYGRIKHIRDNDELLNYLHQARNSEDHGLVTSTEVSPGPLTLEGSDGSHTPPNGIFARVELGPNQKMYSKGREITGFNVTPGRGRIKLVPVLNDKYGDTFKTPAQHLGINLPNMSIPDLAAMAADYLEGVIAEAETLVPR